MLFLERLAEEKIAQALERGDFDNLPGKGKPVPAEETLHFVPEEMRMTFRILKNAGVVPEEVTLMREIDDLVRLLDAEEEDPLKRSDEKKRLRLLMNRLGDSRGCHLAVADGYYRRIAAKLSGSG